MVDSTSQKLAQDSDPILKADPILETDEPQQTDPIQESDSVVESDPILDWDTTLATEETLETDPTQESDTSLKSDATEGEDLIAGTILLGTTSNIQRAFKAVNPDRAVRFTLTNPGVPGNMPPGFNSGGVPGDFHQQGIQKTRFNCFVVSGSAPSFSYFYVTGPDNRVANVVRIDPTFTHAGGIQVAGGILGVGIEKVGQPNGGSRVHFYDLSQPTPRQMPRVITRSTETAGAVGLVQAADGNYIAVVAGWDSKKLTFHRFASLYQSSGGIQGVAVTVSASGWQKYQNINLFLDTSQRLWLVGTHTSGYPIGNDDWGDLYQVSIDWARSRVTIDKREKMHFYRSGEGPRFKWGAGYHFDGNRFEVFSCEAQMPNSGVVRCDRWS